jgi:hypothetical protein
VTVTTVALWCPRCERNPRTPHMALCWPCVYNSVDEQHFRMDVLAEAEDILNPDRERILRRLRMYVG